MSTETKTLEEKIKYLTKGFHKLGVEAKFSSPKWDYYQTLLSKGDESLTDYLIAVYREGGKLGAYKKCAKELGIDTEKFVTMPIDLDSELAWDSVRIITPGKQLLKNEYKRLMNKA